MKNRTAVQLLTNSLFASFHVQNSPNLRGPHEKKKKKKEPDEVDPVSISISDPVRVVMQAMTGSAKCLYGRLDPTWSDGYIHTNNKNWSCYHSISCLATVFYCSFDSVITRPPASSSGINTGFPTLSVKAADHQVSAHRLQMQLQHPKLERPRVAKTNVVCWFQIISTPPPHPHPQEVRVSDQTEKKMGWISSLELIRQQWRDTEWSQSQWMCLLCRGVNISLSR